MSAKGLLLLSLTGALVGMSAWARQGGAQDFATLKAQAEGQYAEGSFELAKRTYERAKDLDLAPDERAWVAFRLADTTWRSAASTDNPDESVIVQARQVLEAQAPQDRRVEERDELWALTQESLGDLEWDRQNSRNWGTALPHYTAALEWWGRSSDLARARERYLGMVWRMSHPNWHQRWYGANYYLSYMPREVLENAARIADTRADSARAHYLLGLYYVQQGQVPQLAGRALTELEQAIELGEGTEWLDDALYTKGQALESPGRALRNDEGQWTWEPDFEGALASYRALLMRFKKGESAFLDDAKNRIQGIEEPVLGLSVERFFLPGSLIDYTLSWRNVANVEVALYPVSLTEDVRFRADDGLDWLGDMQLTRQEARARWTHATADDGRHRYGSAELRLDDPLPPGAYVLAAAAGGKTQRVLILVSDMALTVKATPERVLVWATDVLDGRPVPNADVRLWQRYYDGNDWRLRSEKGKTGADGVAALDVEKSDHYWNWYAAATTGERQSFAASNGGRAASESEEWRIHVQTDRPAYRPGEKVAWRVLARQRAAGEWSTPAGEAVRFEVRDPRNDVAASGRAELNDFGVSWGEFEIPADAALGAFQVRFLSDDGKDRQLFNTTLFRLEEYKLPEFEVAVRTDDPVTGEPRRLVVGDRVAFDVEATYYYGAPVQDATVQVLVYQRPWWFQWSDERPYPWLRAQPYDQRWYGGPGQQVLSTTVTTDATGRAHVELDSPAYADSDLEFTVEARVTDASRREVVGGGSVRVTQKEFYARVRSEHQIHAPGRPVEVTFETRDPNGNAIAAQGQARVLRLEWREVWLDPQGVEWSGFDRFRLKRAGGSASTAAGFDPEQAGWSLKRNGYVEELITTAELRTSAEKGEVRWSFAPPREGTYRVRWLSRDSRGTPVDAETLVHVADEKTRDLGYRPGGVEILLDQDTVAPGGEAVAVLSAPAGNRWILFTVEGETLFEYRVVHLEGAVKLERVRVEGRHAPNVWLGATLVAEGQAWSDQKELIVPPEASFLDVSVAPDSAAVQPGDESSVLVTVRDKDGRPVSADFAIAVYDRALEAIQSDLSQDPRAFFHGRRQDLRVVLAGTFNFGTFSKLKAGEGGKLIETAWSTLQFDDRSELAPPGTRAVERMRKMEGNELARDEAMTQTASRELKALGYAGAAAPAAEMDFEDGFHSRQDKDSARPQGPPTVRVRTDFRKTALWLPSVRTDAAGQAHVQVPYPDSTTRWRLLVRGSDTGMRVGEGESDVRARQPLIARLQAPRFLQVDDRLVVSGNLMNGTEGPLSVRALLDVTGAKLVGAWIDGAEAPLTDAPLTIPAGGETRVDWSLAVDAPGEATLRLTAVADSGPSDGMELLLPVLARGIDALVVEAGRMDGGELVVPLELPQQRADTRLEVQVTPSLAVTMLDALPYLVDYPYGCVEQTLSRFLPCVIVAKSLRDAGLSPEDAMTRVFGGVETRFAAKTHPKGKQALEELDRMVADGLARLYDMQHGDGGFGWWKTGDSDNFMTAYVLWGLSLARDAGIDVRAGVLSNAAEWLALEVVEAENDPSLAAWMLHALAAWGGKLDAERAGHVDRAYERLAKADRTRLDAYTRALLALACHQSGRADEARRLVDNLLNGVKIDESPDTSIVARDGGQSAPYVMKTAHWGADGVWRRWSDGPVEATATALRALVAIAPQHELVEPVTNWLVKNRRGAQWSNTRDTAMAVLALNARMQASGELAKPVSFQVLVNGTPIGERALEPKDLLAAPTTFDVDPGILRDGRNDVTIRRTRGESALYFAAHARFFDSSRPVEARGNEVFVRRQYYRLAPRETLLGGTVYERKPLDEGGEIVSGERVEVVLTIEAKNDLEYLVFEDHKPAGFEAVELQSGTPAYARRLMAMEAEARFAEDTEAARRLQGGLARDPRARARAGDGYTGESRAVHQELRDSLVASFADRLPEGFWELSYELRAEVPGTFVALPLVGQAMYVPEIAANGRDVQIRVLDRGNPGR